MFLLAVMLSVGLSLAVGASYAQASFELVGTFARIGMEGEMGNNAGGVAVNNTTGRVYVADGAYARVTVFDSKGGFLEAWGWGVAELGVNAFQRCGPAAPVHKTCGKEGRSGEGVGEFGEPKGIAVDQKNGNVYVLDGRQNSSVQVFNENGEFITSFGESGGQGKPVSEEPQLIRTASRSGIALDQATGEVFVVDHNNTIPSEGRVMVFMPSGKYEGLEHDFANHEEDSPERVAADFAGNVYVGGHAGVVSKYGVGTRATPLWQHEDKKELQGMTVNPANGNVLYYTEVNKKFHELNPAGVQFAEWPGVRILEEKNGKLEEVQEEQTEGLAFNPGLVWSVGRPAGALYAIDPVLIAGLIFAEPPLLEPSVESESVSDVGTTSALFEASINPHGFDTHYRFQYGTEDCSVHVCQEVPVPLEGDAKSGGQPVIVTEKVTGLVPGTKYHFRVVASSECKPQPTPLCVTEGVDSTFTTFPSGVPGLSDGRVYELVSPILKNGGEVFPLSPTAANCGLCMPGIDKQRFPMQSTTDGSAMVYEGDPFAATGDAVSENEYVSVRGSGGGWQTRDLSPMLLAKEAVGKAGYRGFTEDLSRAVLYQVGPSLAGAPEGFPDLYLQDTGTGSLQPLITEPPTNRIPANESKTNELKLKFAGGSMDFSHLIFEANGVLATETPLEAPNGTEKENNLYEWVNGRLRLVNVLPGDTTEPGAEFGSGEPNFSHAISTDGSRIFWTDMNKGNGHFGHVYVRENGEKTLEVPDPEGGAFLTASADGARVLLNDGLLYGVGGESVAKEADLTLGQHGFQGILGASSDLSTIYFVGSAALTPPSEENANHEHAEGGKDNLYFRQGGSVKFIAVLAGTDGRAGRVTSDGRYLAFMSGAGLTGVDGGVSEVYEYDASTGRLVCASCNPTGVRPIGPSALSAFPPSSGFLPEPRNLSENGRLFFDSVDRLSPLDKNGGFEDVYEYEPAGLGTCMAPSGCVSLISSGQEEVNSSFVNATPSGSDVFFTTSSQLVPQDQDDLSDLYDARVGGVPPVPPPPPPCAEDGCKGPFSPPPLVETLSSTIVTGSGNVVPPPPPPAPPKPPTQKELLAKSLSACRKARTSKTKRLACEKHARKLYGPTKTKAKTGKVRASTHKTGTGKK
jgi:hypothetical protein